MLGYNHFRHMFTSFCTLLPDCRVFGQITQKGTQKCSLQKNIGKLQDLAKSGRAI
jgi:hypothetical protein